MRTFRLLATSLLVALSMGVSSCGDDELDMEPIENHIPSESSKIDKLFDEYVGGNHRITCRGYADFESTILFTGLNAKHLWFALYEKTETKGIKFEWIDKEETDTIQVIHKGYGEYDTIRVNRFFPAFYKKTPSGNIVTVSLMIIIVSTSLLLATKPSAQNYWRMALWQETGFKNLYS